MSIIERQQAELRRDRWQRQYTRGLALLGELYLKFDPSQPRDEHGRWVDTGGSDGGGTGTAIDTAKVEAKTHANVAAASEQAKAAGVKPLPGNKGQHPNTIGSRQPTAKDKPLAYGQPDVASMKLDPKRYEHDINLFKNTDFYPNFRPQELKGSTDDATRAVVDHLKENLKFLYGFADHHTEIWYDGARALVDDRAELYGFNDASIAGVYAALSPTKDWDQNVHIADMLLKTYKQQQGHRWDDKMEEKSKTLWSDKNQAVVDLVRGKTLGELTSPAEKALWIRTYDETHNSTIYRTVLPNGALGPIVKNKDGSNAKVVWQSLASITNAVKALEANGDTAQISAAMGTAHKVRSFYNNILDPHSANGDVTIDTHAVGAALLRPLSNKTVPVLHNFGLTPDKADKPEGWEAAGSSIKTGSSGLYPVYADAYREAAKELGIQPRQLQSAVWVVKREAFGNLSKKQAAAVEDAWRAYHDDANVTLGQTQATIAELAGLKHERRSYRDDEKGRRPGDARELHRHGLGQPTAGVDGGARDGAAGRAAGLEPLRVDQRRAGAQEKLNAQRFQLLKHRFHQRWDESQHPRDPAGTSTGGQFTSGGGGGSSATSAADKPAAEAKPKKSKKPARKDDFDKAKIKINATSSEEAAFVEKWNAKIGIEPEEFKKSFLGGLEHATMNIGLSGSTFYIGGGILDDSGNRVGEYDRQISPDDKSAYSAFFKLNKNTTKHNIGKKVLGGNVEVYEALGLEKLKVSANIDVGGYAWAKYGYVPTASSWAELRGELERKLGGRGAPSRGTDTYEADDWSMLGEDMQDAVKRRWMNDSYSEFLSSEEQNWRESGQALDDAKGELADSFVGPSDDWAKNAVAEWRENRIAEGEPDIPFSDDEILGAIKIDYERGWDGTKDPSIEFMDDELDRMTPAGYDPAQQTLPGIEPLTPSEMLSADARDEIQKELIDAFNKEAEDKADRMDPPEYLADSISEYQEEYWDQKDDDEKLREAIRYGMADIEIERDEDEEPQLELPEREEDELLQAIHSSDPKSIWKVADHPRGKEMLLNSSWAGVLNLKDRESMARFKAYVGKAK